MHTKTLIGENHNSN